MKRQILVLAGLLLWGAVWAETEPIYFEGFSRCIDAEDENYGYTGGNDEQWGGNIATAQTIYQDAPEWSFTNCNGAYQCLKVGTSKKQGSAKTPIIECKGEVVLTFRVAPWEGDSLFYVSLKGGTTTDQTSFELAKKKWTEVTVHVSDIESGLQITFTSTNKHRFFLDDVCVRPADPDAGVIRVQGGTVLDFGLLGRYYSATESTLHIEGINLSEAISATLEDGETDYFSLSTNSLSAQGGELKVQLHEGASVDTHGCFLWLRSKDTKSGETVSKRITLLFEVAALNLEGSGSKQDPYTCGDVILLANNEGTVWTNTMYWATGFVLGGVRRAGGKETGDYDGISMTDKLALVLADKPDETNENRYVTVQISHEAREALNVVDNPELIGQRISVQGLLLNDKANPLYLGLPGVRGVSTDAQYVRPAKEDTQGFEESGKLKVESRKVLEGGALFIVGPDGTKYNVLGIRSK
jgi:hypothetical protein